jgi:hypothetical protein
MALKFRFLRVKQTAYLVGCFGLLLYTLSGLMFRSSMWLFVGAFSWSVIVSGYIAIYIARYRSNRLRTVPIKWGVTKRETDGGLNESWWVGIVGRFFARVRCTIRNHLKKAQK